MSKTNVELQEAKAKAEAGSRAKSDFLATMSHELRTPLTSVIGYSELLLSGMAGEVNEEQTEYIKKFYVIFDDPSGAEAAYRTAKRVQPEFVPARVNLAEMLYAQNRPAEAEKEFREAVEAAMIDNEEGLARDALARFLIRQKRYDEGVEELQRATELMPSHAQTQYFYGVALNSLGRFEEALPYLEKAHELDPNNVESLTGLAAICRDAGDTGRALRYAMRAATLQPENPQLQQLVRSLGGG